MDNKGPDVFTRMIAALPVLLLASCSALANTAVSECTAKNILGAHASNPNHIVEKVISINLSKSHAAIGGPSHGFSCYARVDLSNGWTNMPGHAWVDTFGGETYKLWITKDGVHAPLARVERISYRVAVQIAAQKQRRLEQKEESAKRRRFDSWDKHFRDHPPTKKQEQAEVDQMLGDIENAQAH